MEYKNQGYIDAAIIIRKTYREVLGRDILNDPDAVANWLMHMRENNRDKAWLKEVFMDSDEYKNRITS